MDFATTQREPKRHLGGIALVVLLHAGLVYGLLHGLHTGQIKLADPPAIVFKPAPEPTKPVEQVAKIDPVVTKTISTKLPDIPTPPMSNDAPAAPNLDPATPPMAEPAGLPMAHDGPAVPSIPLAGSGPVSASVACSNYFEIRDVLADKLPLVAERMDFSGRNISRFEMVAQLTVGPAGEVSNPQILQNSNAYASRAMESSVLSSLRKLKCAGQGQARTVQVPLTFSLID